MLQPKTHPCFGYYFFLDEVNKKSLGNGKFNFFRIAELVMICGPRDGRMINCS
jgi:hypothetical protein